MRSLKKLLPPDARAGGCSPSRSRPCSPTTAMPTARSRCRPGGAPSCRRGRRPCSSRSPAASRLQRALLSRPLRFEVRRRAPAEGGHAARSRPRPCSTSRSQEMGARTSARRSHIECRSRLAAAARCRPRRPAALTSAASRSRRRDRATRRSRDVDVLRRRSRQPDPSIGGRPASATGGPDGHDLAIALAILLGAAILLWLCRCGRGTASTHLAARSSELAEARGRPLSFRPGAGRELPAGGVDVPAAGEPHRDRQAALGQRRAEGLDRLRARALEARRRSGCRGSG